MQPRESGSPPSWEVEDALDEVIDAIDAGSALDLTQHIRRGYKDRYRPDFQEQYDNGGEWEKDRDRVLMLSRMVGILATMLTLLKEVDTGNFPAEVDEESAYFAGSIVARMKVCPPDAIKPRGHWCRTYPNETFKGKTHPGDSVAMPLRHFFDRLEVLGAGG